MNKYIMMILIMQIFSWHVNAENAYELNKFGVEYSNKKMYEQSIENFKQALQLKDDPVIKKNLITAYNNYAIEEANNKNYEKALDIIDEALYIDGNNDSLYILKGNLSYVTADYDEAKRSFEQAVHISGAIKAHQGLADVYVKLNYIDDAVIEYEYVISKDPRNIESFFNLAHIHYQRDELSQARKYLNIIQTTFPTSPYIDKVQSMLNKIEKEQTEFSDKRQRYGNHFVVKYQGEERRAIAKELIDMLEDIYDTVGRELGYYPDEEVIVILYTGDQFKNITGGPDWAGAVYDGKIRVPIGNFILNKKNLKQTLIHEYTHLCVFYLTDGKCPVWLNEGIAQYIARQYLDIGFLKRLIFSKKFNDPFTFPQNFLQLNDFTAKVVYQISYVFVKYICEKESLYTFLRILKDIKDNVSAEDAIRNWTYLDRSELYSNVVEYVNKEL